MGKIIGSKVLGDKIIYMIMVDEGEALTLAGRIKHIHMFTLEEFSTESHIMTKGKKNSAKYFVIPIKYKSKTNKKLTLVSTQLLETETKAMFIYICEK